MDSVSHDGHSIAKNMFTGLRRVGTMGLLAVALSSCGQPAPSRIDQIPPPVPQVQGIGEQQPTVVEAQPSTQTLRYIQNGRSMVTDEDRGVFQTNTPGLDMPFFSNERVQKILEITDPRQRVLAAVGFLDVENNPQYNSGVYSCNLYALTLTRLLLGDDVIGSRYRTSDGTPWVLSRGDGQVDWKKQSSIDAFNATHVALDGNNLDWWMKKYGTKLGWQAAPTKADIDKAMKTGEYIGLAVTTQEYVKEQQQIVLEKRKRGEKVEDFDGHIGVFVPGGNNGEYGVSQATNNYTFRGLQQPQDNLMTPEFHTYLYKLPATSWIQARQNK